MGRGGEKRDGKEGRGKGKEEKPHKNL